jgi:hypothetical protein
MQIVGPLPLSMMCGSEAAEPSLLRFGPTTPTHAGEALRCFGRVGPGVNELLGEGPTRLKREALAILPAEDSA